MYMLFEQFGLSYFAFKKPQWAIQYVFCDLFQLESHTYVNSWAVLISHYIIKMALYVFLFHITHNLLDLWSATMWNCILQKQNAGDATKFDPYNMCEHFLNIWIHIVK